MFQTPYALLPCLGGLISERQDASLDLSAAGQCNHEQGN